MLLAARRTTSALSRQGHKSSVHPSAPSRGLATQTLDGVVLTYKPDLELWSLSTNNQDAKIKEYKTQLRNGEVALDESFFDAPFSRLGKPFVHSSAVETSWVNEFLTDGKVDQALSAVEKNTPRLHDYEIMIWGHIGNGPTSAGVQKILNHAVSKQVPLTTTFLGQVMEAFVAARDPEAAAKLFEEAQSKYKLPVTQELLHKFVGLFQLNKQYQKQVAEAQKRLASTTRSRDFSDLKASNLEEVDPVLYDPLLNISADKEKQILKDFAADLLIQTPFEAGMKEWKRRMESYIQWHKAEESSAIEELKKDNIQLIHKYEKRNEQVRVFLEKKFAAQPQLEKN